MLEGKCFFGGNFFENVFCFKETERCEYAFKRKIILTALTQNKTASINDHITVAKNKPKNFQIQI